MNSKEVEKLIKKLELAKQEALSTGYELDNIKNESKMAGPMSQYLFGRADMCTEIVNELKKAVKK